MGRGEWSVTGAPSVEISGDREWSTPPTGRENQRKARPKVERKRPRCRHRIAATVADMRLLIVEDEDGLAERPADRPGARGLRRRRRADPVPRPSEKLAVSRVRPGAARRQPAGRRRARSRRCHPVGRLREPRRARPADPHADGAGRSRRPGARPGRRRRRLPGQAVRAGRADRPASARCCAARSAASSTVLRVGDLRLDTARSWPTAATASSR